METEKRRKMKVAGNGLTLWELEQIELAAHRSSSREAKLILRLAVALREALQVKENKCALCELKNSATSEEATCKPER